MDQVKKILGQYVEWIAIALGAAFLLWVVYGYVIQPPVTVAVGDRPAVTPGQVDTVVWDLHGKKLKAQLDAHAKVTVPVPSYEAIVRQDLVKPAAAVGAMAGAWDKEVKQAEVTPTDVALKPDEKRLTTKVTSLPVLVAASDLAYSAGHTNVVLPAAAGEADAAAPNPAFPMPGMPGMPPGMAGIRPPALPGAPGVNPAVPMPPAAGAVAANQPADKSWVTVGVTLTMKPIAEAFNAAHIPLNQQLGSTAVLRVVLIRQELDTSGHNLGDEQEIAPPEMDRLPPMPADRSPNLSRAGVQTQLNYLAYAEKEQVMVCQPPFYERAEGDKWYQPGTPNPNVVSTEVVVEKPPTVPTPIKKPTANQPRVPQRPAPPGKGLGHGSGLGMGGRGGGGGGFGGGGGGGGRPSLDDDDRRAQDSSGGMPMVPPGGTPMPGLPAGANGGRFVPAQQADFPVWAHDDTVKPGKTYKYKLRYVLYNPVFNTLQLCQPESLSLQYSLTSPDSAWTSPINVESDNNFFASGVGPNNSVKFDVFKWRNGTWQMQQVEAQVGDPIGTGDPASPDGFASGWVLVDIRPAPTRGASSNNRTLLLASENRTLTREVSLDEQLKKHHDLLALVNGPGAPADQMPPDTSGADGPRFPRMPANGNGGGGPRLPPGYPGAPPGGPGGGGGGGRF